MKPQPSPLSISRPRVLAALSLAALLGVIAAIRAAALGPTLGAHLPSSIAWHGPRLHLLWAAPPVILLHLGAAVAALLVGTVLLIGVKGGRFHRTLGWTWVAAMGTVAVSSLFIRQVNPGGFSFLHLFAGWVAVSLPAAVYAARRHKTRIHARAMTGMFIGGLLVAGGFNFVPGRLLWRVFVG